MGVSCRLMKHPKSEVTKGEKSEAEAYKPHSFTCSLDRAHMCEAWRSTLATSKKRKFDTLQQLLFDIMTAWIKEI